MQAFTTLTSRVVPLPMNDIDTDQIIPARFLKRIVREGFGDLLFADWRYLPDGSPNPEFILNQDAVQGAEILLAGDNFGCGSSREHAPWALLGWGFRAVIAPSFADIFHSNARKVGLLPVEIETRAHNELLARIERDPLANVSINLVQQSLHLPDGRSIAFPIDPFAKHCFLNGMDHLDYLLSFSDQIAAFEAAHAQD